MHSAAIKVICICLYYLPKEFWHNLDIISSPNIMLLEGGGKWGGVLILRVAKPPNRKHTISIQIVLEPLWLDLWHSFKSRACLDTQACRLWYNQTRVAPIFKTKVNCFFLLSDYLMYFFLSWLAEKWEIPKIHSQWGKASMKCPFDYVHKAIWNSFFAPWCSTTCHFDVSHGI